MAENTTEPTYHDVDVPSWRVPSGFTWLDFDDGRILGGAKLGNEVWFGWIAGSRSDRPFAFAQIVRLSTQNFTLIGSADVWDQNAAVGYPALAANSITEEVGVSYTFGRNDPSHAVGILTGTTVHETTIQGNPTNVDRWGDYLSIRQDFDDTGKAIPSFAATGYVVNQNDSALSHFVEFSRASRASSTDEP